jgi:ketosteroid isomerase-like protein
MSHEPSVESLAVRAAIQDVLTRYCRAIDRCDAALLRSCYHGDAYDDHGIFAGGRDEFVDFSLGALRARNETHGQLTSHVLGNVTIEIAGDTASVESYFTASHVEDRQDHFRVFQLQGRYLDEFSRRADDWRIARRLVVHDWSEIRENRRALQIGAHRYAQGSLHPSDPLYSIEA